MTKPLVSFVVPTHNRIEWVAQCVGGLLAQTIPEVEVVIVDDGSSDGTADFLDEWLGEDKRVKIHHNPMPMGAGRSRNKGIELATAPLIGVADDDDSYPVQRADRIVEFFKKYPEGHMMTAPYVRIGYEDEVLEYFNAVPFDVERYKETGAVNYFCHPAAAYTKKDILEIGGYRPETKFETDDLQLVHDWVKAGKQITLYPDEYLCLHRVLPRSIMSKIRGFKEQWAGK